MLMRLSQAQLEELAALSAVPVTTLIKVRNGQTGNPRLNTVHQFFAHLEAMLLKAAAPQPTADDTSKGALKFAPQGGA